MTTSNRLAITEFATTQEERAVIGNEAIAKLEIGANVFACITVLLNTPPGSPTEGDSYIVGLAPTGAWSTYAGRPISYINGAWLALPVAAGMEARETSSGDKYVYLSGAWAIEVSGGGAASFASTTEQLTGTATTKASTPNSVAALWEQGSDVASAGTISFGEGGYFVVTGTTTITDIDFATDKAGRPAKVKFAGILTLTHGANLILPTGANISTAAGDTAEFISEGSDVVRCVWYTRADGTPLVAPVNALKSDSAANLTAGFTATAENAGTKSSGTFTPDPDDGNFQRAVNGGAHILASPSPSPGDSLTMIIQYTNNGSAGAITTSGFTLVDGDAFTTVNGDDFMLNIVVCNGFSVLTVKALP